MNKTWMMTAVMVLGACGQGEITGESAPEGDAPPAETAIREVPKGELTAADDSADAVFDESEAVVFPEGFTPPSATSQTTVDGDVSQVDGELSRERVVDA